MDLDRAIPLPLANLLRVIHIALWMTIPAALWLWLWLAPEPTPRACEPNCGWYDGNVLGVYEDTHIFILNVLLVLGFLSLSAGSPAIGGRSSGEFWTARKSCRRSG